MNIILPIESQIICDCHTFHIYTKNDYRESEPFHITMQVNVLSGTCTICDLNVKLNESICLPIIEFIFITKLAAPANFAPPHFLS